MTTTNVCTDKSLPVLALGLTPAVERTMLFSRYVPGGVNRAREVFVSASGKCVNVATALARLGNKVYATGFNGGANGRLVVRELRKNGVMPAFTPISAETRVCTTIIDESSGEVTELVEEAPKVSARKLDRLTRECIQLMKSCSFVSISGTLPKHFAQNAYEPFAREARRLGVPWIIDSHLEPLMQTLQNEPELVKLNRLELCRTFGRNDENVAGMLRRLTDAGAKWALMTDGANASLLSSQSGELHKIQPSKLKKVINPIGSGDCVGAGIIHGLLHGMTMPQAVTFGTACGSANAATYIPAYFDYPEF